MTRLNDLILQLCPRGVEFWNLGDVLRIRNGKDYKQLGVGKIPVYGSGGVMTTVDTAAYSGPSVLIPRKGSLDKLYYVDVPFWTVDTIFYTEIGERLVPKFLFYQLQTQHLEKLNQAGGVPSLTQATLIKLRIPVPPTPVQEEIVRVLDSFHGLEAALEAALEAEIKARQRQHGYYRQQLLTFTPTGVSWQPMADVASIGTGSRNTNEAVRGGRYPFFVRSQEPLAIDTFEFDEAAVITAGDGVGVGKVFHFVEGKYALHQRAYRLRVTSPDLLPRFLFHFMRHDFGRYLATKSVHASVTSLRKPMFEKYLVPTPSLPDQQGIVDILDRFDALVEELSVRVRAELKARRGQYEYYREKLLTFDEAAA